MSTKRTKAEMLKKYERPATNVTADNFRRRAEYNVVVDAAKAWHKANILLQAEDGVTPQAEDGVTPRAKYYSAERKLVAAIEALKG